MGHCDYGRIPFAPHPRRLARLRPLARLLCTKPRLSRARSRIRVTQLPRTAVSVGEEPALTIVIGNLTAEPTSKGVKA